MKKLFYLIALLVMSNSSSAQVDLDSLLTIWNDEKRADTIRMEALNKFIWGPNLFASHTDSALTLSILMHEMAIRSKSKKYEANALQTQGTCYSIMKDPLKGKDLFEQSLQIAEEINYHDGIALSLNNLGVSYKLLNDLTKAKDYYLKSLNYAEQYNNKEGIILAGSNLAGIYLTQNELTKAEELYTKVLNMIEEVPDPYYYVNQYTLRGTGIYQLGEIFLRQEKYSIAIQYYQNSLLQAKKKGDNDLFIFAGHNLARVYHMQNDWPEAEELYIQVLEVIKENPKPYYYTFQNAIEEQTHNNLGPIFIQQRKYAKGIQYFRTSLLNYEKKGDNHFIAHNLTSLGDLYTRIGDFTKATDYLTRALTAMEDAGEIYQLETWEIMNSLGHVYKEQKNYSKALEYHSAALKKLEKVIGIVDSVVIVTRISPPTLGNIANDYKLLGDYEKAGEYAFKAIEATQDEELKKGLSIIIGNNYRLQSMVQKAILWCEKGISASDIAVQKDACECLYESHKALKNGNEALAYHEKYLILTDSLHEEEIGKNLQQMEFQNQILADSLVQVEEKRKVELAHQEEVSKKNRTRNILLGSGFFLLLIGGGLFSRLRYVRKSKATLQVEKDRSENLLLNILPAEIAEELKMNGEALARDFDMVSIIFTDFKGFTESSEKVSAAELVGELNHCFKGFDAIMEKHGIEKIKTIGDAYMAAGGLPVATDDSIQNTVKAALEMQQFMTARKVEQDAHGLLSFQMRAGIHTGPVVAGIVGVKKFQYDIWGDTVNTASRMESNGEVDQVNISQDTYEHIKNNPDFTFRKRGKIQAKGKGEMEMYFVT